MSISGRLLSDMIDICDNRNSSRFVVTLGIEKTFDTLDHSFLILVLKKFVFGQNLLIGLELYQKTKRQVSLT